MVVGPNLYRPKPMLNVFDKGFFDYSTLNVDERYWGNASYNSAQREQWIKLCEGKKKSHKAFRACFFEQVQKESENRLRRFERVEKLSGQSFPNFYLPVERTGQKIP
jgi:hypothetical protein